MTLKCLNRFNHFFQANNISHALAAMTNADTQNFEWFPDSATINHVTRNLDNLHALKPYHSLESLMVRYGVLYRSHILVTLLLVSVPLPFH